MSRLFMYSLVKNMSNEAPPVGGSKWFTHLPTPPEIKIHVFTLCTLNYTRYNIMGGGMFHGI